MKKVENVKILPYNKVDIQGFTKEQPKCFSKGIVLKKQAKGAPG